ncbi:MAG: ABC transporter permease [Acidobacteriota bacterium]|nr:MAG: ABC transporter permease [Acidobacteriota bacterium]
MDRWDIISNAFGALIANKMRSVLSVLGIVVGISALVAIVALIDGANRYITDQLVTLQPDVIQVSQFPSSFLNVNDFMKASKWKKIEYEDYLTVLDECRQCETVGATSNMTGRLRWRAEVSGSVQVRGVTANILDIERIDVATGRFFTKGEEDLYAPVCLIGADVVSDLFSNEDPLGADLVVMGKTFRVIGTLAERGAIFGSSQDRYVIIPLTAMLRRFGSHQPVTISSKMMGGVQLDSMVEEVNGIMRKRRRVLPGQENTFFINTAESATAIFDAVIGGFYIVTILISGISLTVGGLGVTNIMLVNVRERTREIGLRRAVGARSRDVLWQFLTETVTLCLFGGLLGTLTGMGIAQLIGWLTPLPASSNPAVATLGFVVASVVGVISGVYPARRASKLDPIESLRYE